MAAGLAFPLGGLWLPSIHRLFDPTRLDHGLVIVLPGIEGWGPLNWSIARGLHDGGFPGAILVYDWTTGIWPFFVYHLRAQLRSRRRAAEVARVIVNHRKSYPGSPVHIVGHSGGAALAIWALESLPDSESVTSVVLLAPALSPTYPLTNALKRTQDGVYNFWSALDVLYLAAGTLLFGTADGRHTLSAGFRGFAVPSSTEQQQADCHYDRLHQRCYTPRMLAKFHWGGHFGWANRVFVAEEIAPLLIRPTC